MPETGEQAAADRHAGARDARQKREGLARTHDRSSEKADALGRREMGLLLGPRRGCHRGPTLGTPPQLLEAQHQESVQDEETCRLVWAGEQRLDAALEEHTEDCGRDGADHEQHREALRVRLHLAPERCREEAPNDRDPLVAVEDQEGGRGADVQQNEEGQERWVGLLEAPVEDARHQDRMAERRDGEQLARTLQQAHEQCLPQIHRLNFHVMAQLGVFNPAVKTLEESVLRAKMAERLGFKSIWTTQMPDARDAALVLAAYAQATERVNLGTGVLPIYPRHPTAMAQMAASLDELSGGRFILGLGVSHKVTVEAMWGR